MRDLSIQQLWDLDVIGISDPIKDKTNAEISTAAVDHFRKTVTRNAEGRYIAKLPWVEVHASLPSYRGIAISKLDSCKARLEKQGVLNAYHEVFMLWEQNDFIERVDGNSGHYLSHHGVIKPESKSTPVRPVFNASFRTKGHPSLNDCLVVGPSLLEEIPNIVTRFRLDAVGVTADIEKAFPQIEVAKEDRDYLRFMWYKDETFKEVQTFRHKRVVFGVNCSPFLLQEVLNYHMDKCDRRYKATVDTLKPSLYVDNVATSLPSKQAAEEFQSLSTELLAEAKMNLRDWVIGPSQEGKVTSVLGVPWNTREDTLGVNLSKPMKKMEGKNVCRRRILSLAHSIFDPLGLVSPFTITPKMILQETCKLKVGWDSQLPEEVEKKFNCWSQQIPELKSIAVPRHISTSRERGTWSLHVFSDASSAAYGVCAYLRSGNPGEVCTKLMMARARVAPLKGGTIPRLELVGCRCASRLATAILKTLEVPVPCTFWTDSTTALAWIKSDLNWSVFVSNRVKEVRSGPGNASWRHVPEKLNPADLASRGASVKTLLKSTWWEGPEFLKLDEDKWPNNVYCANQEEVDSELRKTVTSFLNVDSSEVLCNLNKASDYYKIVRFVVYLRRVQKLLHSKKQEILRGPILHEEFQAAELKLFELVQHANFEGVEDPKLKRLRVFVDEKGIIRLKTRLFPGEHKESATPIVLPAKDETVQKMIQAAHLLSSHAGVNCLLCRLRERFWIIGWRRTIRSVVSKCVRCRRFRAKAVKVEEGPLPKDRTTVTHAFDVVGVDMAGPLYLKDRRKVWICIFTCASTRGIHLELCSGLSTDIFLLALRRFIARRGRPSVIYSDNGLNFVGAANLLSSLDWSKIADYANVSQIRWKFNPPTAAWWGGIWERMIGVVKQLLRSVLGSQRVNNEELLTLLCDIESVVNDRPLTYISEDDHDFVPLTPNSFIRNCGPAVVPDLDNVDREHCLVRYRNLQSCRDELRSRFQKEYFAMLVHVAKGRKSRDLTVGEVVLVEEDNKKRLNWPMGVVSEVLPGRDGHVRYVKVKTAKGELTRTAQRLFPLEFSEGTGDEKKEE